MDLCKACAQQQLVRWENFVVNTTINVSYDNQVFDLSSAHDVCIWILELPTSIGIWI